MVISRWKFLEKNIKINSYYTYVFSNKALFFMAAETWIKIHNATNLIFITIYNTQQKIEYKKI